MVETLQCPYCNAEAFHYNDMFLCHDCQRNIPYERVQEYVDNLTHSNDANISRVNIQENINYSSILHLCESLSNLPSSHDCVQYVRSRGIPDYAYNRLWYTRQFREIARYGEVEINDERGRLILPFFDKDNKLFGLQARSLDSDGLRYLTIMFNKNENKLFGLEQVDITKPFIAVEGPIDSLFLKNCIAIAGSDILPDKYSTVATIALDNEPRNKQIIQKMHKYLDLGFSVVIWPDTIKEKDINDMVNQGLNPEKIIEKNTYKGMSGKIQLNSWKKI